MTAADSLTKRHRVRAAAKRNAGPTAWEIAQRLDSEAPKRWTRWAGHYGPLLGSWWPPALRSPNRKLHLLIDVVLATIVEELGRESGQVWSVECATDDQDVLNAMIISGPGTTVVTPISANANIVTIGGHVLGLRARDAGSRVLDRLVDHVAAALATPERRSAH